MTQIGPNAVTHNAKGNLTAIGSTAYSYDSENRLRTTPVDAYDYDPLGALDSYENGASRLAYDGTDRVAEYGATGTMLRRHVFGAGTDEPLVWYEGTGTANRRFLHADERGSIVAVTGATGAKLAINRYDEYGLPDPANIGRFQYTGQALIGSDLYYYKARMYLPRFGRFMQPDPIGYAGAMNLYGYVGGDPVNFTDPLGLCAGDGDGPCDIEVTARQINECDLSCLANAQSVQIMQMDLRLAQNLNRIETRQLADFGVEVPESDEEPQPDDIVVTGRRMKVQYTPIPPGALPSPPRNPQCTAFTYECLSQREDSAQLNKECNAAGRICDRRSALHRLNPANDFIRPKMRFNMCVGQVCFDVLPNGTVIYR